MNVLSNEVVKYFVMILLVMIGIFVVKKVAQKYNIPGVSTLAEGV
jgi:hypothetical protein